MVVCIGAAALLVINHWSACVRNENTVFWLQESDHQK